MNLWAIKEANTHTHTSTHIVYKSLFHQNFQVALLPPFPSSSSPLALRKPPVTVETLEHFEVSRILGSAVFTS